MPASDVDHIEHGDNHNPSNLQALCRFHHARKSAREGAQAKTAKQPKREREREQSGSMRQAMLNAQRDHEE
jgi:hypothetical protein